MTRTLAAFVAGAIAMLGGTAVADKPDQVRTTCHAWAKPRTWQCNVYAPNFDMLRVKWYEDGVYSLGVDYTPGHEPVARIPRP